MTDVIIIGGGLSGLAAAVELATHGFQVSLFEQSQKLGGRCYSFIDEKTGDVVDNGQHVLVGAYHNTLRYLDLVGTRACLKEQAKLSLPFFHPQKGIHTFSVSSLPRPLHLTTGMLTFSLLSFADRKNLLNVGFELQKWNKRKEQLLSQLTIDEWLTVLSQSTMAKQCFWNPIAISVMNELPERASALLFGRSIRATFLGKKSDSAMLIPTVGQTELYVHGAEKVLKKYHAKIYLNQPVENIVIKNGAATGVMAGKKEYKAQFVISAVPYFALSSFVNDEFTSILPTKSFQTIESSPILSLHLWFDKEFMELDTIGLIDSHLQWVFNRRRIMPEHGKQTGYITAVISGAHNEVRLSKDELIEIGIRDIHRAFPQSKHAKLVHALVIKEKRATFSPTNETESIRPNTETNLRNFFFAGDWTNTSLPATIEGAVLSGFKAAEVTIAHS